MKIESNNEKHKLIIGKYYVFKLIKGFSCIEISDYFALFSMKNQYDLATNKAGKSLTFNILDDIILLTINMLIYKFIYITYKADLLVFMKAEVLK